MLKRLISILLLVTVLFTGCSTPQLPTWQEKYDLGLRYLSEGNYREAILAFEAAIEIDPKQADAYVEMANAYLAQNDTESARKVLEEGLRRVDDRQALQLLLEQLDGASAMTIVEEEEPPQPEEVEEVEEVPALSCGEAYLGVLDEMAPEYAKLMDMDGDGKKELLLTCAARVLLYSFIDGEAVCMVDDQSGGYYYYPDSHAILLKTDGTEEWLCVPKAEEKNHDRWTLYMIRGDELTKVEYEARVERENNQYNYYECMIDGVSVDMQTYKNDVMRYRNVDDESMAVDLDLGEGYRVFGGGIDSAYMAQTLAQTRAELESMQ